MDALDHQLDNKRLTEAALLHLLVEPDHQDAHETDRGQNERADRHRTEVVAQHTPDGREHREHTLIYDSVAVDVAITVGVLLRLDKVPICVYGSAPRT